MATIRFCGAAGTVTGSCSLIQTAGSAFLVDCGLFQGNRTTQDLNYQPFPFDVNSVKFLLLTHAHIDHSGLIPKLIKAGFDGPIFATEPTCDLLQFMLPDSAYIQESNVDRLNRKRRRMGLDLLEPIYTKEDASKALALCRTVQYEQWINVADGIEARYWNAGHLLGSASIEVRIDGTEAGDSDRPLRMLFSGDLGPEEKAFHPEPDAPQSFDYIVCESTYGNRDREDYTLENRREAMKQELTTALNRGGNVVIPSFAVERSQELLHDIGYLLATNQIPDAKVYLDSPLARRATEVFIKHAGDLEDIELPAAELFRHPNFRLVQSVEESKSLNKVTKGAIIISASGMCTAGRIKHHLANNIFRKEATILFVGYQSPGTLGHIITSGAKDVRIHGKQYHVAAAIRRIGNYSAHADQGELIDWILQRGDVSQAIFLNHGEDDARETLRQLLIEKGWDADSVYAPGFDEVFELVAGKVKSQGVAEHRIDTAELRRDWYNDYAAFILELGRRLETTDDVATRHAMIDRVRRALD
ncbi:MBL fold metallo-hydrolase RNA specificity domain-containing protein [Crateriforma spongiae]|uniref:MBL fold metallo-hydrolase RNA specificity domain-containing protein n=1 Tax=Crateriforma spongiae TaxID=2724528 RepID=UPI0014486403|nr:MBL fold metallo-hydrolase [Crateriforma spongiae]